MSYKFSDLTVGEPAWVNLGEKFYLFAVKAWPSSKKEGYGLGYALGPPDSVLGGNVFGYGIRLWPDSTWPVRMRVLSKGHVLSVAGPDSFQWEVMDSAVEDPDIHQFFKDVSRATGVPICRLKNRATGDIKDFLPNGFQLVGENSNG